MQQYEDTNSSNFTGTNNSTPISNSVTLTSEHLQPKKAGDILNEFGGVETINGQKYYRLMLFAFNWRPNSLKDVIAGLKTSEMKVMIRQRLYGYSDVLDKLLCDFPFDLYIFTEGNSLDTTTLKEAIKRCGDRALDKTIVIDGGAEVLTIKKQQNNC